MFSEPLFDYIYSFHMPLFFAISGMSAALSRGDRGDLKLSYCGSKLWNKFRSIELPNLIWGLLVPYWISNTWNPIGLYYTTNPYWFLQTLFIIFIFHYAILYGKSLLKIKVKMWMVVLLFLAAIALMVNVSSGRYTIMYFCFFYLGFFAEYLDNKIALLKNLAGWSVPLVIFVYMASKFDFGTHNLGDPDRYILEFPISVFAFWTLFYFAKEYGNQPSIINKWLSRFGQCSMLIYIFHYNLITFHSESVVPLGICLQVVLLIIIAFVICAICYYVYRLGFHFPVAMRYLFGYKK